MTAVTSLCWTGRGFSLDAFNVMSRTFTQCAMCRLGASAALYAYAELQLFSETLQNLLDLKVGGSVLALWISLGMS